jgi:uncharacterized protein (DUF952 family)
MRKVFNYDDWSQSDLVPKTKLKRFPRSISACGCLFRKENKILLIKYEDPQYPYNDDFGGQVDEIDHSPLDTIVRETCEESNDVITKELMAKMMSRPYKSYYDDTMKYYNIVLEVDEDFFPDTSIFGDLEITDNIKRTLAWYDITNDTYSLAFRMLKNKEFMHDLQLYVAYKLVSIIEYDNLEDEYAGNFIDKKDGFIHMSKTMEQVDKIIKKYFRDETPVILTINLHKLNNVKIELAKDGECYAHQYGTIPKSAILSASYNDAML